MADTAYDAYRFEHGRPDMNAPDGVRKVHYISVQQSREAAFTAVKELTGGSGSLKPIDRGVDVLRLNVVTKMLLERSNLTYCPRLLASHLKYCGRRPLCQLPLL
jgi:hypothetical protein